MTTKNPPLLRNAALCVPPAVLLGALVSGAHALAAGLSGVLVLLNLAALQFLGPRVVESVARGESGAFWSALLLTKLVVLTAAVLGLLQVLPPLGVGLGFVPLVLGVLLTGIELALREQREGSVPPFHSDPRERGSA